MSNPTPSASPDVITSAPLGPPPGVAKPPKYPLTEKALAELDNRFEYHAPKDDQASRCAAIRAKARELALTIAQNTPISREQALALTHLDEAVMFANAAIARNE